MKTPNDLTGSSLKLWWDELPETWKNVLALNIIINLRGSKIAKKIFIIGQNPFESYEVYFKKSFDRNENPFTDEEFENLPEIKMLYAADCKIEELEPLCIFRHIEMVDICQNEVSDISPLEDMHELTELYAETNKIRSIDPLANLINLQQLNIRDNRIKNIIPISKLNQLVYLDIGRNEIEDIIALQTLSKLEELQADINRIKSGEPLTRLVNLKVLALGYNPLTNCDFLCELQHLKYLALQDTPCDKEQILSAFSQNDQIELLMEQ